MRSRDAVPATEVDPRVGLCCHCESARVQRNRRGDRFWRCGRADTDRSFPRYPALPVQKCAGFRSGENAC